MPCANARPAQRSRVALAGEWQRYRRHARPVHVPAAAMRSAAELSHSTPAVLSHSQRLHCATRCQLHHPGTPPHALSSLEALEMAPLRWPLCPLFTLSLIPLKTSGAAALPSHDESTTRQWHSAVCRRLRGCCGAGCEPALEPAIEPAAAAPGSVGMCARLCDAKRATSLLSAVRSVPCWLRSAPR